MAAGRRKRTSRNRKGGPGPDERGSRAGMLDAMQQIWLAGMGAISRAQKEGPAAFQEAVAEGLKLLGRSRATGEKMMRDALEAAQGSVQSRLDDARGQAAETWDNLEALFQSRVQKSLQQIGVPTADEVRLLTRRVAELNESVKRLARERPAPAAGRPKKRGPGKAARSARRGKSA